MIQLTRLVLVKVPVWTKSYQLHVLQTFHSQTSTRQFQFVSIEAICIISVSYIFIGLNDFYAYLNIMENSLSASSDTPLRFLAWICCSRLCCILIPNWSSWSHCWANPTVLCSVYLKSGNKCQCSVKNGIQEVILTRVEKVTYNVERTKNMYTSLVIVSRYASRQNYSDNWNHELNNLQIQCSPVV